jgi:nucleotide-binding universal stress UspA family protein
MNVNIWNVADPIQALVRSGKSVDQIKLANPQVPLETLVDELRRDIGEASTYDRQQIEFWVRDGDPARELLAVAEHLCADALVVGASAHAGHRLIGSLASRLVRSRRIPITVVP